MGRGSLAIDTMAGGSDFDLLLLLESPGAGMSAIRDTSGETFLEFLSCHTRITFAKARNDGRG